MSQRVVTPWLSTNIPGAYPNTVVKSAPVGLGASGLIVLIGEADGGNSYQNVALSQNVFSPDQFALVQSTYLSGPIVDAFKALTAPSGDAGITGSASRIFIVKTNQGTQASALVDTNYGTFRDQNWGAPGNQYKFQLTSIATEVAPSITGGNIPALGAALNGLTFGIRLNGGAQTSVTLSATAANHTTVAQLVTELTPLLPAGVTVAAGAGQNIVLTMNADANAYRNGYGKALELVDTTTGNLAALGLSAGVTVSSSEPGIELVTTRSDIGLNEIIDTFTDIALSIGYVGTTATASISSAGVLTTTVTGGAGGNLTINLSQFRTISDLATYINAQPGYSALVSSKATQQAPAMLDVVTNIGICATGAGNKPGRIRSAAATFQKKMATSRALAFVPTALAGLPNPMSAPAFLSGGTRGGTAAIDIVNAIAQLGGINCNIIVPLFSEDATLDIAAGLTDPSSTYTLAAVHAAVKSHCLQYSAPKLKRNRMAILSMWDTYQNIRNAAQSLAHYRCALTCQKVTQVNAQGAIVQFMPWLGAVVAAGMQAGGFYKSITNKYANIISFQDPSGFDSGNPGSVEDALDGGLLVMTKDVAGSKWISDQTTYGYDTNFVYNSIQAVYCSDILALDLAQSFQSAFVGQSLADVSAASALSFLSQKMDGYKKLKLIAPSDDAPLGWKNGKVQILAPEMDVFVEIKLATAVYFIPINISVSQVQQSS